MSSLVKFPFWIWVHIPLNPSVFVSCKMMFDNNNKNKQKEYSKESNNNIFWNRFRWTDAIDLDNHFLARIYFWAFVQKS